MDRNRPIYSAFLLFIDVRGLPLSHKTDPTCTNLIGTEARGWEFGMIRVPDPTATLSADNVLTCNVLDLETVTCSGNRR